VAKIGEAYVDMMARMEPLERALRQAQQRVEGATRAMQSRMQRFAANVSATLGRMRQAWMGWMAGIYMAQRALRAIWSAYERQELAERRLAAVLRATGGAAGLTVKQLQQYAAALQQTTRFGDEAVMEIMAVLATFKSVSGPIFLEATKRVLDLAEVMGTDARSSAIQLGKALEDPKIGLTALRRVGISFTEAQTEMIKKMVEMGEVTQAQTVILKALKEQVGGTAEAMAEGAAGALAQFTNALGDTAEALGRLTAEWLGFQESAGSGMTVLDLLKGGFNLVADSIEYTRRGVTDLAAGLVNLATRGSFVTGGERQAFFGPSESERQAQEQIDAINRRYKELQNAANRERQLEQARLEERKKLNEELRKIQQERLQIENPEQAELNALQRLFNERMQLVKDDAEARLEVERWYQAAVAQVRERYAEQQRQEQERPGRAAPSRTHAAIV